MASDPAPRGLVGVSSLGTSGDRAVELPGPGPRFQAQERFPVALHCRGEDASLFTSPPWWFPTHVTEGDSAMVVVIRAQQRTDTMGRPCALSLCASPEWAQSRRPRLSRKQLRSWLPGAGVRTRNCHETPGLPPPVLLLSRFSENRSGSRTLRREMLCWTVSPVRICVSHFCSRVRALGTDSTVGGAARKRALPEEHVESG